jgi:dihydrofolate reductase
MRKLSVFDTISLDGRFTDKNNDMSWAHGRSDDEWNAFTSGNASGNGVLVFGRVTYDMMVSFWPTDAARKTMPEVAEGMNKAQKIVFSRTLNKVDWNNTRLLKGDIVAEMHKLKEEPGADMVILGSGSIVAQFADAGLIDSYQLVIAPVAIGAGRTLFEGVSRRLNFTLLDSRAFKNGNVVLTYAAV